jgi:hypothetical protein
MVDPRTRASLLWGVIAALAFLVLAQAARLVIALPVGLARLLAVAVVVFAVAAGVSHVLGRRLDRKRQL